MPKKICIVSEYAYNCIKGNCKGGGGAELQMSLLAKCLQKEKFDVNFITFSDAPKKDKINNVVIYNPYNSKVQGISHFFPQNIFKLMILLYKIDPDIIIQSPGSVFSWLLSIFSKLKNKKFILVAASDLNVSNHLKLQNLKDILRLPYIFAIKTADYVICQTETQKELLKDYSGINGIIIKNLFIETTTRNYNDVHEKTVLWVGRIIKSKRPEIYLELAKKLPEFKFIMIGGSVKSEQNLYDLIELETKKINNLLFLGFIPHEEIYKYFIKSDLFISTSEAEGFPNTFIEAWGSGTPISSLFFNPDDLITKKNLGLFSDNFEDLVKNTLELLNDDKMRNEMGKSSKKYVKNEHSPEKIISQYKELFSL